MKKFGVVGRFLIINIILFCFMSGVWLILSNLNEYDSETMKHDGPAYDRRSYCEAVCDAYLPVRPGRESPHFLWWVTVAMELGIVVYLAKHRPRGGSE